MDTSKAIQLLQDGNALLGLATSLLSLADAGKLTQEQLDQRVAEAQAAYGTAAGSLRDAIERRRQELARATE